VTVVAELRSLIDAHGLDAVLDALGEVLADRCLFCLAPAEHEHHPTARLTADGPYLDGWTVPTCRCCHAVEHVAWRAAGIDELADPLLARLGRNTWLIGRLADLGRPVVLLPDTLRGHHDSMVACVELAAGRLDEEVAR
jgi:hypothetical protein